MTNWEKYFGTPEKAAVLLDKVASCGNGCILFDNPCNECINMIECWTSNLNTTHCNDTILEWLKEDAE